MTKQIDWSGGDILVTGSSDKGWTIEHRLANNGGHFDLDWFKHKYPAMRKANEIAKDRGARLFIQERVA